MTPVLLKMIRGLSENEQLDGLINRADIYEQWFKNSILLASLEENEEIFEKCMHQLEEISFKQMLEGNMQRYQNEVPGYEKSQINI